MATQAERRETTRARLVDAAFRLFVRSGYEATSTQEILARAAVSRGALYHHFPTKQDLFEAVFEAVSAGAIERAGERSARARAATDSPLEQLTAGCLAWLREAREPTVGAILLDQGPKVLGWLRAREIENRHSLAVMKAALEKAAAAGEIAPVSIDLTAGILNAALAEAALASLHDGVHRGVAGAGARVGEPIGPKKIEKTIRDLIAGLDCRRRPLS